MTSPTPEAVAAGHAFYSRWTLAIYDPLILGWFCRFAWRCPASTIRGHYDEHVSANHLDVGVGTGYFLDRCQFPSEQPRLTLMDLNEECLASASRRVVRYRPETLVANVLDPIPPQIPPTLRFDSVGLSFLLHCLPGDFGTKSAVFSHVSALANPGAPVFGATILGSGLSPTWYARRVMAFNNRRGIFSNSDDDLTGLRRGLADHLDEPTVRVVGSVALFVGVAR